MNFLLNLSHYVKSYGHFCQIVACFTMPTHSNMVMLRYMTQVGDFENFQFCPDSTFN